jgi:hypothetical protein
MQKQFSEFVAHKIGHYVYRLIDPRFGTTFYVGRGQGNRVFSHAAGQEKATESEENEALKLKTIRAIINDGFEVEHVIHRHGMDENTAKEVEAALIEAYPGLSNLQGGYDHKRGVAHAKQIIRDYEPEFAVFEDSVMLINVNKSSEEQCLYDAVRYAWKVSLKSAGKCKYVLAVTRGLIIGVFKVMEWLPATKNNFPDLFYVGNGTSEGRYGFIGDDDVPGEVRLRYMHKRVPDEYRKRGAAFPIRYPKVHNSPLRPHN